MRNGCLSPLPGGFLVRTMRVWYFDLPWSSSLDIHRNQLACKYSTAAALQVAWVARAAPRSRAGEEDVQHPPSASLAAWVLLKDLLPTAKEKLIKQSCRCHKKPGVSTEQARFLAIPPETQCAELNYIRFSWDNRWCSLIMKGFARKAF